MKLIKEESGALDHKDLYNACQKVGDDYSVELSKLQSVVF